MDLFSDDTQINETNHTQLARHPSQNAKADNKIVLHLSHSRCLILILYGY